MVETIGSRIRSARKERGLTQVELAELVDDLDHTAVSKVETGTRRVASHELFDIAQALGVTTAQLVGEPVRVNALAVATRLTGTHPDYLEPAIERVKQILEMDDLLSRIVGPAAPVAAPEIARPTGGTAPAQGRALAKAARAGLGLGSAPVKDVAALLETRFGAHVVAQPISGNVHGLCVHDGGVAVVLVNTADRWARQRYTLAHELAHLIMDDLEVLEVTMSSGRDDVCERRAESFAAHFLAPDDGIREVVGGRTVDMAVMAELLDYFGVSLESMCWRLFNLKLIDAERKDEFMSRGVRAIARAGSLDEAFDEHARTSEGATVPPRGLLQRAIDAYADGQVGVGVVAAVEGSTDPAAVRRKLSERGVVPPAPAFSGADLA